MFDRLLERSVSALKRRHKVSEQRGFVRRFLQTLSKTQKYAFGWLLVLLVIFATSISFVHADQASKSPTKTVAQKITTRPATLGPAQTNGLFSTYPSWAQNFATDTATTLNQSYWNINVGPAQNSNNEAEYYTDNPTNVRIASGALTLEATQQSEPQNYQYASARIDTNTKVSFLYGRIDVTAELPVGVGTWPAVWLLPATNKYEDLSPASDTTRYVNGGEIDLIEAVGFQPNVEYGIVHTLADLANPDGVGSYNTVTVPHNNSVYTTYSLLWTPTSITFAVNNKPFYTYNRAANADYTTWPFDQPFYLIANLAIGGSWGGQDTADYPNGINNAALPAAMHIRSIYYYPYTGSTNVQ